MAESIRQQRLSTVSDGVDCNIEGRESVLFVDEKLGQSEQWAAQQLADSHISINFFCQIAIEQHMEFQIWIQNECQFHR